MSLLCFLLSIFCLIEKMDTSSFTNGRLQKLRGERVNSDKFQLHIIIQDSLLVSYQIFKKRPEDVGFVHDSRSKMPLRQSTDVRQPFSAAFHQNQYIKCANCYFWKREKKKKKKKKKKSRQKREWYLIQNTNSLQENLTLSMLGKNFSRWHSEIFFLFFPATKLWHSMQTNRNNLHGMSKACCWENNLGTICKEC